MAVTVNYTAGLAGYAAAGDRVNVYTVVAPNAPNATPATAPTRRPAPSALTSTRPFTKLLLSKACRCSTCTDEVVSRHRDHGQRRHGRQHATSAASSGASNHAHAAARPRTLSMAEQVIFATSVNQLYFTVLPKGQGTSKTKGVGYGTNYPIPVNTTTESGK